MKKRKLLTVIVAAVVSASVFMTGCGKKDGGETTPTPNTPGTENPTEEKLDADQTINVVGYDFKTLDPSLISDTQSFTTLTHVYECLVREVVKDGVVTNEFAGAESLEVSADSTVYTYKLRKDAKWSDGQPVTAKDYVFSWKRITDPRNAADYMTFLEEIGVKGATEVIAAAEGGDAAIDAALANLGVKAVDDYTFEVTLAQPTAFFESAAAFKCLAPQREDKYKEQGQDNYGSDFTKMVYNGPFVISEYAKGSKIVYKKNPNYWNAKEIKLETGVGHIVEEEATLVKMFEGKELDVTGATGENLSRLASKAGNGEFEHFKGTDTAAFFNYFNVTRPVIKNPKVRLAISASVNRQQFLDVVFKRNFPSNGIVPMGMGVSGKDYREAVEEPLKTVTVDPKALFLEGLKEEGITDPSTLKIELLNGPATTLSKSIAEYWQKTWKDTFGFELVLNFAVDSQTYFKERQAGNFDLVSGGWGADYNDASSFFGVFLSNNPNNNGKYNNPEYDKLVLEAAKATDADKRIELYKKAETLLVAQDAAVIPTHYRDINQFRHNYVKGMYIPKFGGLYDLTGVYITEKQ